MSRKIEVNIDTYVAIDMAEFDTYDLIDELIGRKKDNEDIDTDIFIPSFKTPQEQLNFVKAALGLKDWDDKNRVLQEIESLYNY